MVDAFLAPAFAPTDRIRPQPQPGSGASSTPAGLSEQARELIVQYLPMVESIARRIYRAIPRNSGLDLRDLAQSGLVGLVSAGRCYDPATAVPFSVYARHRVAGEILDSLRREDPASRKLRTWQRRLTAALHELSTTLNREPTEQELCDRLNISELEMRQKNSALHQLRRPPSRPENGTFPEQASGPDTDPGHLCAQRQLHETLDHLIKTLPEPHRLVIRMHYAQHRTMKEIGGELGVKESRVSQIHRRALQAMARKLKNSGIHSPAQL